MPARNPQEAAKTSHVRERAPFVVLIATNKTLLPFATSDASVSASQLVRRTQPCDCVWPTVSGSGVP